MRKTTRTMSLILSIVIVLSLFQMTAFATKKTENANCVSVGDFITFGTFNEHPLLWRIVANDGEKIKLFCAETLFSGEIDASMHEVLAYANLVGGAWEGDSNWHTSDIRTYLNSNEETVAYKGASANELPSYSTRAGFLTNFSESELDIIQEITHKSHTQYHRTLTEKDGGSGFARIETYTNIIEYDEEAYEDLSYLNVTERVFLPDAKDLKEVSDTLNESYLMEFAYNDTTDSYYAPTYRTDFWTREPVIAGSSYLFWGMYFLDTTESMDYCGYATFKRGIRPMCYIQLEATQALSGDGTLASPYALSDSDSEEKLQIVSLSPEKNGTLLSGDVKVSMTFNYEVESFDIGSGHGLFLIWHKNGDSYEQVYSLSDGDNINTDVTISGKTVTIIPSGLEVVNYDDYLITMDTGVITFKGTDRKIGISGNQWVFKGLDGASSCGFTLGTHNNSFTHSNSAGGGFEGISKYPISDKAYNELKSCADLWQILMILYSKNHEWHGHCEGVSSTMLLAFAGKLDLSQFEKDVDYYFDMPRPCENDDFLDCISYFHLAQRITDAEHSSYWQKSLNGFFADSFPVVNLSDTLTKLIDELANAPVIFTYSSFLADAHTILALDYKTDSNGNYIVTMYDLNSVQESKPYGEFTELYISKDFETYKLTTPNGSTNNLDFISYVTLEQLSEVNIYNASSDGNSHSISVANDLDDSANDNVAVITMPMSATSYTIKNASGERLVCDKDGNFSGTIKLLNLRAVGDGSNSQWEFTLEYSDSFTVTKDSSSIDVGVFTNGGCLTLESSNVGDVKFITNKTIQIEKPDNDGEYEFTAFLYCGTSDDDAVRMIKMTAISSDDTTLTVENGRVTATSYGSLTEKEIVLIEDLEETSLSDQNSAINIIEVSTGEFDNTPSKPDGPSHNPQNPGIAIPSDSPSTDSQKTTGVTIADLIDAYGQEYQPFPDVTTADWFYSYVADMTQAGVVSGYPDGTFRPQGEVTWGEALKLVMKAVGYGDFEAANGHWAGGYMAKALEDLLISSEVDLNAPITRAEMANLVANALKLAPSDNAYPFEDEAPEAAVALYAAGIITGSLDNGHLLFRADSTITRAEMAAIIWRVYNK